MKRPTGITIVCLALGWLALAGFVNAFVFLSGIETPMPMYVGFIAAAYGITALVATIGLWRMQKWGLQSLRAWMLVCVVLLFAFVPVFGFMQAPPLMLLLFVTLVASLFWALNRYVSKKLHAAA
jgi:uncharacterized membrane protein (DUF2068 family)